MDSTVRVSLIAIFLVIWSKLLSEQESGESMVTGMRVVHLTEEAPMVSIPKVVGVLSCSFLLCLGLSNAVQAEHAPGPSDVMKTDSVTDKQGFQSDDDKQKNVDNEKGSNRVEAAKTIQGELTRVEDGNYFVKVKDGKEVRLHTDKTTKMMGEIKKGDRVEAQMNNQNHALSIHLAK
jgi:uncharacterized membrane protein YcgQ (UPF0703/DUF1980 family)